MMRFLAILGLALAVVGCGSDESDCPTCENPPAVWADYDGFADNSLDAALWNYIDDGYGGQVLEAGGQLQVWGHTESWTGVGIVRTVEARPAWEFVLTETYFEEGPGCQGWYIQALDAVEETAVELLNRRTEGCGTNMGDGPGTYQVWLAAESLEVYKDGALLRSVAWEGIGPFVLDFQANNAYGSGHHSHIFVDDVRGVELALP